MTRTPCVEPARKASASTLLLGTLVLLTGSLSAQLPLAGRWNGVCVECDKTDWRFVLLFIVLSWGYVLLLKVTSQTASGFTKIVFFFVQTTILIVGKLQSATSWINIFNFAVRASAMASVQLASYSAFCGQPQDASGANCVAPLTPCTFSECCLREISQEIALICRPKAGGRWRGPVHLHCGADCHGRRALALPAVSGIDPL